MAEELGIKLKIDTKEGIAKARDEIEKFIHEYKDRSIKLKIFDKGDFANLSENIKQVSNQVNNLSQVLGSKLEVRSLDEVNKQFGVMLTRVDSLEKVKVTGEGMEAFTQEIVKGVDAAGKLISATRVLEGKGKNRVTEKNDYAAEAKALEKLAKAKDVELDKEEKRQVQLELKRVQTVNTRVANEQKALEKLAKAKDVELDKEENKTLRLQAKQVNAVNKRVADEQKALEKLAKAKDVELDKEERKQLQLDLKRVNTVNTRVAKEQKAAEDIMKANEKAADAEEKNIQRLEIKRVKAVEQRVAKAEKATKAEIKQQQDLTNAVQNVQNRLTRIDSSKVNEILFKRNKELKLEYDNIAKSAGLFNEKLAAGTATAKDWEDLNLNQRINNLNAELYKTQQTMGSFTAKILANLKAFISWYAIGNLVGATRRKLVEVVDTVKDLNKQLVNLQMATGYDYDSTLKLMQSYSALGAKIGATTSEVASSADAFLRQGQTIEDTNTLIYASMVLSKVGQIESATSTEYLTAAMKAYGVQVNDVIGIVDKLSSVDVKSATSAGGLAEAMSRTATAAQLAGISMDKLLGYLAVVGETTQKQMSEVGTSFQAIFSRMGNVKAGKSIDDSGESLNDVEKVLNRLQINLRDSQYQFRNFGDVLDEVAGKWKTYTNVEQNQIATAVAGTRQRENFLVLMSNYNKSLEYTTVSATSAGKSLEKMQAYEDSVEAATKRMTVAFESLSNNTLDANFLINAINAGTKLTQVLDFLLNKTGGFTPVLAIVTAAWIGLGLAQKAHLLTTIAQIPANIKNTVSLIAQAAAAGNLSTAFTILNASAGAVGLVITAISGALWLLVKAADWTTTSLKEHKEALTEVSAKYSELTGEISDLETQIANTSDRLNELLGKDVLTIVEQEELDKLKESNAELQRQLDIKKAEALFVAEQKAKATQDTFDAQRNEDDYYRKVLALQEINRRLASNEDAFLAGNLSSDKYNKQQNKLNTDYDKIRSEIVDLNNAFTPLIQSYDDLIAAGGELNEEQQSQYDWWKTVNGEYNNFILSSNKTTAATNAAANSAENAGQSLDDTATKLENLDTTYKEYIKDVDFATEQAERQKKSGKEQIAVYQGAIDKIKEQIALYRTMGLDDTSDEVQTLTKKIWEYEDAIAKINETSHKDLIKSFSDLVKEIKSVNDALEEQGKTGSVSIDTYLDLITNNADLIKVFKTENGQIILNKEAYKSLTIAKIANIQAAKISERQAIIDKINEENKAVSSLISTYNNMFINQAFVDFYQGAMDGRSSNVTKPFDAIITALQKVMDSLKDDIFDFNPPKDTSSDPWKKEFEDQYKVLQHKRGMNIVSTEDYYNQLSALNEKYFTKDKKYNDEYTQYQLELYNLKKSMFADSIEDQAHQAELLANKSGTEQQQIQIYENILKQLHAKANEYRAKGIDENDEMIQDLQKQYKSYQDKITTIYKNIADAQKDAADKIRENAKEQKDALKDVLELTKDLIKQEAEDRVDALTKIKDGYREIVDLKKKSLETGKKENDYEKELAKKVKEIAALEAKYNLSKNNDSLEGRAIEANLLDELTKLKMETADFQEDYAYEKSIQALEDSADAKEKSIDNEIDLIKSSVDSEVKLYNLAIQRIDQSWSNLYSDLIGYQQVHGNGIDTIADKWGAATDALKNYSNFASAMTGVNSISSSESNEDLIGSLKASMQQNSADWFTASDAKKIELSNSNKSIASQIASITGKTVTRTPNGVWMIGNEELYNKKFHTGGAIGGESLLQKEVPFIGEIGEHVLTKGQQKAFLDMMATGGFLSPIVNQSLLKGISNGVGNISNNNSNSNVQGAFSPTVNVQITATDLNDRELDRVANTVVNKINGVFNQYGITNSRLGRVR